MAPDVKIRDLDPETYALLRERARQNDRSMEAELRVIVSEAVGSGSVNADDWKRSGFDEVSEIVPGRIYEAWADHTCYRISITRSIVGGSAHPWNSTIDQLHVTDPFGTGVETQQLWIRPTGIAQRLLGDTADMALRDAIRWLSEFAGVDAISRARREAEAQ